MSIYSQEQQIELKEMELEIAGIRAILSDHTHFGCSQCRALRIRLTAKLKEYNALLNSKPIQQP